MENLIQEVYAIDVTAISIWWRLAIVAGIVLVAYLADIILVNIIIPTIRKITAKTETETDDILLSDKVCHAFTAIIPPVILTFALPFALKGNVELIVEESQLYI